MKHPRWQLPTFVILVVTLGIVCGCSRRTAKLAEPPITGTSTDPAVELKAEWRAKHQYLLSLQLDQNTQVRNRHTDEDFAQDVKFRLDFNAVILGANPDQNRSLNLDLTGLMFELTRGDTPLVHYDTSSRVALLEDDQRTTDALDKLLGSRWRYTIAPNGSVISAEMDTNSPTSRTLDSEGRTAGLSLVKRLFNPHFFRPFLEFNSLPDKAVKVGDSWAVDRVFNAGTVGAVEFKGTCTFLGWQLNQGKRCARMDLAGTLSTPTKVSARLGRVLRGSSDLEKGSLTGRIWFDPEQALPVQSTTDLNMTIISYQRSQRLKDPNSTNPPPAVRLIVPLTQRISLKISDLGELPAGSYDRTNGVSNSEKRL